MKKFRTEHIALAIMFIIGAMAFGGYLLVILGVIDSRPPVRTVESIKKQIEFYEAKFAHLRAEKEIDLIKDRETKAMIIRGYSGEKSEELNKKFEEIRKKSDEARDKLISKYEAMIEKLRKK